jgi:hypothetical protein
MNRAEYLFTSLAEELSEASQRASKVLRFGADEVQPGQRKNNVERLNDELLDVAVIVALLRELGVDVRYHRSIPEGPEFDRKREKVLAFMEYARECGTLHDSPGDTPEGPDR